MINLRFDQVARITGGTLYNTATMSRKFMGVSIDSRTVSSGELFVAVRGENNDGHDYIDQALGKGAVGVISETTWPGLNHVRGDVAVVAVENSHEAMMQLARNCREESRAKFVGITGSNGKTTTKELTFGLVSAVESEVYRSPGNYNNLFGMPLSLFGMPDETRVAVMEMGISVPGEMTKLARMVQPNVIVITNVGPSHLQFLGSVRGVAKAKLEMVRQAANDVPVIINGDDDILVSETKEIRDNFITFAVDRESTFTPDSISTDKSGVTTVLIEGHAFRLPMFGRYQVYNLLAAYAAFKSLGYSWDGVDTELIELGTAPMRGEKITRGNVTFISDCYNANPDSVKSGLLSFDQEKSKSRRVIILGDMLELGEGEKEFHRQAGEILAGLKFDLAIMVGPLSAYAMEAALEAGVPGARVKHYGVASECASEINGLLKKEDLVFVKGSRGIGLESVINAYGDSGKET